MKAIVKSLAEEAECLPVSDRVRLVEHLLSTLDRPDPSIDRAWAEESEQRLDAYVRGEITARDAEHVLAKHLKP